MSDQQKPVAVVTVEEVRAEAERWAKHMRTESVSDEWSEDGKRQFVAVAEAYEEIVDLIDHGPTEAERGKTRMLIRRMKEAHGGRRH